MASLITVRLEKGSSPSLGFRLQGGKDFGTPLVIQKVNGGSPAERAGLLAGDSVIKVNTTDVFNLRHKDAQDVIVRAGPAFELTVQRGGSVWKPSVIPTGPLSTAAPTVTKTSLAAPRKDDIGSIGTGHNLSAKPFGAQLNGAVNGGPKLVNNQYNSPLKLYSEESIAETLSAQTEVLSTGVLGVNFKKNEKNYDATNSAVYRMLQEAEKEPKTPEPVSPVGGRQVTSPRSNTPLDDHSRLSSRLGNYPNVNNSNQEGVTKCTECERVIVGVFVRIKDKNLHVECFKCSTCGTSLKNVGYYNINNKLYCDVHAKLAARANPPAPSLVPVTVPPGGKAPASAISSALASHSLPSPSPLSPKSNLAQPFQPLQNDNLERTLTTPLQNLNITPELNSSNKPNNTLANSTPLSFSKYLNKAGNYSTTPKPFSSVSAPVASQNFNTLPKAAPLSPAPSLPTPAPAPTYSPVSSTGRSVQSFVWPPPLEEPEVPTACPIYIPPSTHLKINPKFVYQHDVEYSGQISESQEFDEINIMALQEPKLSLCSEEICGITGRRSAVECVETIAETLETQRLIEDVLKNRPKSPPPPPLNSDVEAGETNHPEEGFARRSGVADAICGESGELKRLTDFKPNTTECKLKSQVANVVPQKWESPMVQALRTVPEPPTSNQHDPFTQIPKKFSSSPFASALAIAPSEPFLAQPPTYSKLQSVPLPEETEPYFPPEHPIVFAEKKEQPKPESKFVKALQTAPERPFTPVGSVPRKKEKDPTEEFFKDLPKPQHKLTMREALTTASDRPYTPISVESIKIDETYEKLTAETTTEKKNLQRPTKSTVLPASFQKPLEEKPRAPKPFPLVVKEKYEEINEEKQTDVTKSTTFEKHHTQSTVEEAVESSEDGQVQGMYPLFKGFSCSFSNKSEHSQFSVEINTTPPLIKSSSQSSSVKVSRTGESSESITETVTEASQVREKTSQQSKENAVEKQAEQIEVKRPLKLASALHKPEGLPQYQVNLGETVEAEMQMMQKAQAAKVREQEPKPPREVSTKPVITVQPGEKKLQPEQSFKPVCEDRPPSSTFSVRPRPITPSMINKPAPSIPYYQASLVAQHYHAPEVNLLDPTSPIVSRSPSPCPGGKRSLSPFCTPASAAAAAARARSPAAGPPPNPLRSGIPIPTPRHSKVEAAKKNLTVYLPQHESKMSAIEQLRTSQPYIAQTQTQYVAEHQTQQVVDNQHHLQVASEKLTEMKEVQQTADATKSQLIRQGQESTAVLEESHMDHLEQTRRADVKSVEKSNDGLVQVQRKKTVTEEFEHTQKAKVVQIEKNTSRDHPFKSVNTSAIEEPGIVGMHVTNPQPIVSPFLKHDTPLPQHNFPNQQQCPAERRCSQPTQQPHPIKQQKHVQAPSLTCPTRRVPAPSGSAQKPDQSVNRSDIPVPNAGSGGGRQAGAVGVAPKRGRGVLNAAALGGTRIPLCASCYSQIRGPFITALGKIWCPDHFVCATPSCRRPLQDLGFVEEQNQLYCEYCFEQYLAPACAKCSAKIKGDCLKAIGKNFHPECFSCVYCGKLFGNSPFFLEEGNPYCETDWNELFTTKCFACGFPVEAGDRWVEALNNNWHSQCFNCTMCKKNLEGQSFFAKGGRPFCKNHAR